MKFKTLAALAVIAPILALTACGTSGPSPSDKTPSGVIATAKKVEQLTKQKQGKVVCDEYMTADLKALVSAFTDCAKAFNGKDAAMALNDTGGLDPKSVKVTGDTATFMWGKEKSTARYEGGHWRLGMNA